MLTFGLVLCVWHLCIGFCDPCNDELIPRFFFFFAFVCLFMRPAGNFDDIAV